MGNPTNPVAEAIASIITRATNGTDDPEDYRDAGMMLRGIREVLIRGNTDPRAISVLTDDIHRLENLQDPEELARYRAAHTEAVSRALHPAREEEPAVEHPNPV